MSKFGKRTQLIGASILALTLICAWVVIIISSLLLVIDAFQYKEWEWFTFMILAFLFFLGVGLIAIGDAIGD